MKVKFLVDVTWSDDSVKKGAVIDLDDARAKQFIDKGFVERYKAPAKKVKHDIPVGETDDGADDLGVKPGRSKKAAKR